MGHRTIGKRMSIELSRLYGDPIPSPEELAKLEAKNAIYDRDDGERSVPCL